MSELRRAVALAAVGIASCSHGAPVRRPGEPRVVLAPAGAAEATVVVEVARTPAELQRGLMYRERLDPGRGMLFLFPRPERLTFWMHNTYVPLDMIFIGSDHRVVGVVENATPLTDDPRAVEPDAIKEIQALLTLVDGRVVYEREGAFAAPQLVRATAREDDPCCAAPDDEEHEHSATHR